MAFWGLFPVFFGHVATATLPRQTERIPQKILVRNDKRITCITGGIYPDRAAKQQQPVMQVILFVSLNLFVNKTKQLPKEKREKRKRYRSTGTATMLSISVTY